MTNPLEIEFERYLADSLISGFLYMAKVDIVDVPIYRTVGIKLGVIEDIEHLKTHFDGLTLAQGLHLS